MHPLSGEFPGQAVRTDLLFRVVDAEDRPIILHIELQGRSSHQLMEYRQLGYLSRIVIREELLPDTRLHSVVIYVGEGAGRHDKGQYHIAGLGESVTLNWNYQVIRLWELSAEHLLATGRPELISLIGQTQMAEPKKALAQATKVILAVEDVQERDKLLTSLVTLLPDKELSKMVEQWLENEGLLLDTPFIRKIRQEGWREGQEEGLERGVQIGRSEGLEKGVQIGREEGVRQATLQALSARFPLLATESRRIEKLLNRVHNYEQLQSFLPLLFEVETFAQFEAKAQELVEKIV